MTRPFLFVLLVFAVAIQAEQTLVVEPYTFRTYDGKEVPAELGKLWVRENRNGSSKRLIQIALVRLRSTAERPGSPIVFLAGGPGVPGILRRDVPGGYFRTALRNHAANTFLSLHAFNCTIQYAAG
jgi:hypothetical protein